MIESVQEFISNFLYVLQDPSGREGEDLIQITTREDAIDVTTTND